MTVRRALASDVPALEILIAASARRLSHGFYTDAEIEAAIIHVFGVDSDLITDGSYFVAEHGAKLAGCGGWSARQTLFGGDRFAARTPGWLDAGLDPARVRAFFVAPDSARQGVGTILLKACEAAAANAGFTATALMSTLPGVPFYVRHGYHAGEAIAHTLGGVTVKFVPMAKNMLQ